ncbi:putative cyclin-B3-1 isoform X1 [Lactuca sativa]|uniref:Cyclin N-terminal domain-containing protein n=1 Tax=Lactuca sativa TaxID=4236 RepID=A0A9R1X2S4_LACSA|nr:putative cyclin-B3-1 isoform X1 [Lactuca sativa]KAJ0195964.1 hypothetical protein LSAT_V11C700385570 [Lactuca sativa]
MVAVKGLNTFKSRVSGELETRKSVIGGVRSFKVYTENEKVKVHSRDHVAAETTRKSMPVKAETSQIQATCLKGALNKLDKIHGKNINSTQGKVARKVLGDISNSQGNLQKNEAFNGSKSGKVKMEKVAYLQRASIATKSRNASSLSGKLSMGTRVGSQSEAVEGRVTQGRVGTKDSKVFDVNTRTRLQSKEAVGYVTRESTRNYRPPQRKSFPVLKHVEKTDTCDIKKGNLGNKAKNKDKFGFSVKPKVGTTVVPQVSNGRDHRLKNRVSDGSINMVSEDRSTGNTKRLSRRSMKPTVKTTIGIPKVSRRTTVFTKPTSSTLVLFKKKEETSATCVLSKKNEETSNPTANNGKSRRRKSYTSLLIEGSKMLKDLASVTKEEILPSIYDDRNQLEVSEYVDEIYQHYWVTEAHHQSLKNYMEIQTDITPQMRGILINWLIEVHLKFDLMQETLYLMVTLLDYYLSVVNIKKNEMQLVGLTSLLLASKYEDFWHPKVMELISISAELYTRDQMLKMETTILHKLNFRLNLPTPYVFMLRFLRAAHGSKEFENLAFFLIELSLVEYDALHFKPSLLCASAIYVARCTLHLAPPWTPLLSKHSHYQEHQIRDCAEMILRFHQSARKAVLKVTFDKYMSDHNYKVASIRPLNRLPSS